MRQLTQILAMMVNGSQGLDYRLYPCALRNAGCCRPRRSHVISLSAFWLCKVLMLPAGSISGFALPAAPF
jgi:hypothetical protein